jgi:hypothetical protein
MADKDERRVLGRLRRENAPGGRKKSFQVYVTDAEEAELSRLAELAGMTVPRLLFESALRSDITTSTRRAEAIAEIFAVRRLMANVANNVNQVAKFANSESAFPAEAEALVAEYRGLVPRMSSALGQL